MSEPIVLPLTMLLRHDGADYLLVACWCESAPSDHAHVTWIMPSAAAGAVIDRACAEVSRQLADGKPIAVLAEVVEDDPSLYAALCRELAFHQAATATAVTEAIAARRQTAVLLGGR